MRYRESSLQRFLRFLPALSASLFSRCRWPPAAQGAPSDVFNAVFLRDGHRLEPRLSRRMEKRCEALQVKPRREVDDNYGGTTQCHLHASPSASLALIRALIRDRPESRVVVATSATT